jgi:peptide/nickel transport system permease protein
MSVRLVASGFGALLAVAMIVASAAFPDAFLVDLANRLAPPSQANLLGTDELGRDFLSRLIFGTRFSLMTAIVATIVALLVGVPLASAVRVSPTYVARIVTILAYACFVAPSFLLSQRWSGRVTMAIVLSVGILPASWLALAAIASWSLYGLSVSIALGLIFSLGVAFALTRFDQPSPRAAPAGWALQLCACATSMFAWALFAMAALDAVGLGVRPPESSWGSVLAARSASPLPALVAGLCIVISGLSAFALGDALSLIAQQGSKKEAGDWMDR